MPEKKREKNPLFSLRCSDRIECRNREIPPDFLKTSSFPNLQFQTGTSSSPSSSSPSSSVLLRKRIYHGDGMELRAKEKRKKKGETIRDRGKREKWRKWSISLPLSRSGNETGWKRRRKRQRWRRRRRKKKHHHPSLSRQLAVEFANFEEFQN